MSEGYEYNLLTQELLLQGYTAEHYPDYVRIGNGRLGKSPLENSCGGFIYTKDYLEKKAFMSGCGLYVSWEKCINDIDYLEETFCFENDNVVFRCPWHKKNCEQNHPLLREDNFGFCACHMVSDYQYEKSAEYLENQADQKKKELFQKFKEQHKNCICKMHMSYNYEKQEWSLNYDPMRCRCEPGDYCTLKGRTLSEKSGNIYYDIKVSTIRKDDTFFAGEPVVTITRGKKFLQSKVSVDICEEIAKRNREDIFRKEWFNGYSMQALYDPDLKVEILNVRVAARLIRDKVQDLQDEKAGINVSYEADFAKANKKWKQKRKEKRLEQTKRKIVKKGWESLNDTEQRFMKKRLSVEQIEALQQEWVTANSHKDEAEQLTLNLYNNFRKDEFELNGKTKVKKNENIGSNR